MIETIFSKDLISSDLTFLFSFLASTINRQKYRKIDIKYRGSPICFVNNKKDDATDIFIRVNRDFLLFDKNITITI